MTDEQRTAPEAGPRKPLAHWYHQRLSRPSRLGLCRSLQILYVTAAKSTLHPRSRDQPERTDDHFIYAKQMESELAPTSYYIPSSDVVVHSKHPFIMYVIAHRISCVSRIHGPLVVQDELPAMAHLWSVFYKGVAASIMSINRALSSPNAAEQQWLFMRIVDVLSVEVSITVCLIRRCYHNRGRI